MSDTGAVERTAREFEHTPEAAAFGAAIEQAAHDSGVGWDEVHPIELACRLMAAGYALAAATPTVEEVERAIDPQHVGHGCRYDPRPAAEQVVALWGAP